MFFLYEKNGDGDWQPHSNTPNLKVVAATRRKKAEQGKQMLCACVAYDRPVSYTITAGKVSKRGWVDVYSTSEEHIDTNVLAWPLEPLWLRILRFIFRRYLV